MTSNRYLAAGALALGVLISSAACAPGPYYGYGRPTGRVVDYRELDRRAYDNGFRDGARIGEVDARDRRDFRVDRDRVYRVAEDGFYHQGAYSREQYQRMFRQGYEAGYSQGYDRVGRAYGGNGRRVTPGIVIQPPYSGSSNNGYYNSTAAQNGYRDGIEAGRDDARGRGAYDPVRAKRYREGDHDYSNRDGSRDEYKREYRAAFQQGYEQGYREF